MFIDKKYAESLKTLCIKYKRLINTKGSPKER